MKSQLFSAVEGSLPDHGHKVAVVEQGEGGDGVGPDNLLHSWRRDVCIEESMHGEEELGSACLWSRQPPSHV